MGSLAFDDMLFGDVVHEYFPFLHVLWQHYERGSLNCVLSLVRRKIYGYLFSLPPGSGENSHHIYTMLMYIPRFGRPVMISENQEKTKQNGA